VTDHHVLRTVVLLLVLLYRYAYHVLGAGAGAAKHQLELSAAPSRVEPCSQFPPPARSSPPALSLPFVTSSLAARSAVGRCVCG